jgi:hypothetical protein
MSAESKRKWRADPRNRQRENEMRTARARSTEWQRLREAMRDTLRRIDNKEQA